MKTMFDLKKYYARPFLFRGIGRVLVSVLSLIALSWVMASGAGAAALEKLTIATASGQKSFDVEVMRTDAEREKGLMFRNYLPADRGMLFDFGAEREVFMWMKDTPLPLDMVFIRKNGSIARIAANTEPYSLTVLSSGEPVIGVLEINAGISEKLGIRAGDKVIHPLFKQ
jgi:uncharacterized membrane protein (UPF0127 family)